MSVALEQFNLTDIAARLESLEETIIFKFIDRVQFRHNPVVYEKGKSGFKGTSPLSLFAQRLRSQEKMDAEFGRFCLAEERPFCKRLPLSRRELHLPTTGLVIRDVNTINLGDKICKAYLDLVPQICMAGDDGHYGSSVEHDVYALQALARRIHYGSLYVAESKFRSDPVRYTSLSQKEDINGLLALLTRQDVEQKILSRIRDKISFIQTNVNQHIRHVIDPSLLYEFYRDSIIPLTKEGEVLYLLNRQLDASGKGC